MAFYSIDQGGQPMNASTFTFDRPNLKAAVPVLAVTTRAG
jgi:hypothetical protein